MFYNLKKYRKLNYKLNLLVFYFPIRLCRWKLNTDMKFRQSSSSDTIPLTFPDGISSASPCIIDCLGNYTNIHTH